MSKWEGEGGNSDNWGYRKYLSKSGSVGEACLSRGGEESDAGPREAGGRLGHFVIVRE